MLDLEDCPFCGSAALSWPQARGKAVVGCASGSHVCAVQPHVFGDTEDAIKAWNTRAALSRAPEAQPADPASVLPVLAHLVATGQATDKQRAELLAALSPPSTGGEGEANQVGAAEAEVGRYVYRRIERLMDAKPGTVEGAELCYLAEIAEGVEE